MIIPYKRKYFEYTFFYNTVEQICFVQKTWLYFPFFMYYRAHNRKKSVTLLQCIKGLCTSLKRDPVDLEHVISLYLMCTYPHIKVNFQSEGLSFSTVFLTNSFYFLVKFLFFYLSLYFMVAVYELYSFF